MIFSPSSSSPLASRSTPPSAILSSKLLSKPPSGSTKKRKKSRTILKLKKLKNHPLCRAFPLYTAGLFRANNKHPPGNNCLLFSQCANRASWASSTLSLHRISSIQIITEFLALNHPSISNPDMDFLRDCPLTFPLPNSKNRPSGAALRLRAPQRKNPIPAHTGMGFAFFKVAPASNRPYNKNSRIVYM